MQGVHVRTDAAGNEVWAKWLADGRSVAVVLLNLGANATSVTATWADLKLGSGW